MCVCCLLWLGSSVCMWELKAQVGVGLQNKWCKYWGLAKSMSGYYLRSYSAWLLHATVYNFDSWMSVNVCGLDSIPPSHNLNSHYRRITANIFPCLISPWSTSLVPCLKFCFCCCLLSGNKNCWANWTSKFSLISNVPYCPTVSCLLHHLTDISDPFSRKKNITLKVFFGQWHVISFLFWVHLFDCVTLATMRPM